MAEREYNVLFLCTGNSARSIMAECAIGRWGKGKFKGYSAGSHPTGEINPMTLRVLRDLHYDLTGLRSKSWDVFARADSPPLDFVFTVCDQAAGEACPLWPGQPITAHWGVADPATFAGPEEAKRRFFLRIYGELENRIKIFTSLRMETLDRYALEKRVREIGKLRVPYEEPVR
jgi:protein-tyrosine-phosphatase